MSEIDQRKKKRKKKCYIVVVSIRVQGAVANMANLRYCSCCGCY